MLPRLFTIECDQTPDQVKGATKNSLVGWFEARDAPRGWIVGPVLCLWRTALANDDVVYAIIRQKAWRTQIVGFALDQLAGVFCALLLVVTLLWLVIGTASGSLYLMGTLPLGLVVATLLALVIFWSRSETEARTISFLRSKFGNDHEPRGSRASIDLPEVSGPVRSMQLQLSGRSRTAPATVDGVIAGMRSIERGDEEFLILFTGEQCYLQAAPRDEGFVVEWRDGSEGRHFVARVKDAPRYNLSADEILALALIYLQGGEWPDEIQWGVPLYR